MQRTESIIQNMITARDYIMKQIEICTIEDSPETDQLCEDFLSGKEIKE